VSGLFPHWVEKMMILTWIESFSTVSTATIETSCSEDSSERKKLRADEERVIRLSAGVPQDNNVVLLGERVILPVSS
jgi:hypothetical protein